MPDPAGSASEHHPHRPLHGAAAAGRGDHAEGGRLGHVGARGVEVRRVGDAAWHTAAPPPFTTGNTASVGAWRSLVAHLPWTQGGRQFESARHQWCQTIIRVQAHSTDEDQRFSVKQGCHDQASGSRV
jgi:hypothetical protein